MIRSAAASLGLAALLISANLASAETFSPGEQCRPAGVDLSQVRDCRVQTRRTGQTCRCVVMPGVNEAARVPASKDMVIQEATPTAAQ